MYQIITHNKDEWTDDEMSAFDIYNEFVETYKSARLYHHNGTGEEELLASYGAFPY